MALARCTSMPPSPHSTELVCRRCRRHGEEDGVTPAHRIEFVVILWTRYVSFQTTNLWLRAGFGACMTQTANTHPPTPRVRGLWPIPIVSPTGNHTKTNTTNTNTSIFSATTVGTEGGFYQKLPFILKLQALTTHSPMYFAQIMPLTCSEARTVVVLIDIVANH
jgi:hypothetical protein